MVTELIPEVEEEPTPKPFAEFLEETAPGNTTSVTDLARHNPRTSSYELAMPDIQLYCRSESCNGTMFFRSRRKPLNLATYPPPHIYVTYRCSNCLKTSKIFALVVFWDKDTTSGKCYKVGEIPRYGPPTPSRLIDLIGPDRDIFLKGRNCENQGLGIGAFAYYRRVVENQKDRIISEIIRVANKLNAPEETIRELEAAKAETQFRRALDSVKKSIPAVLLIGGHNPLRLLHSALSDGLHVRTDAQCLERAGSIRVVLTELSERLSQALKDEAELNKALSHLLNPIEDVSDPT